MEEVNIDTKAIDKELITNIEQQDLQNTEWNTLVQMGQDAGETKTYTQWLLGKLGDVVMEKYGDLKKYAAEIRQDYGSLRQYMNTYRKFIREDANFHPKKYFGSIPWGVLALAATKSDEPQKLVDNLQAENKEISIKTAYKEIKRLESPNGEEPTRRPVVKLYWDKSSHLYKLIIDPKDFPAIDWTDIKSQLKEWLDGIM